MGAVATTIPVHLPARFQSSEPVKATLLELVRAVCDETEDDDEVVAIVLQMLRSDRVRLCGNFRGAGADAFR